MLNTLYFFQAVVAVLLSMQFDGIPIFLIFLACVVLRLVLAAVTRTADGGVSYDSE